MAPLLADGARLLKDGFLHSWRRDRLKAPKYAIAMVIVAWVCLVLKKLLILVKMPTMDVIRDFMGFFFRRRTAERQPVSEAHCDLKAVLPEELQRSISSSERGLRQTEQHVDDCRSSNSDRGSLKRGKRLAQLLVHTPEETRFATSGGSFSVPAEKREEKRLKKATVTGWDSLPNDIRGNILRTVEFRDLCRCKAVSKSWKKYVESDAFRLSRPAISEGSFTAINYYIKNQAWRCNGYDLHSKLWRALPPFSYLPTPDPELFKEYSVCGHGGLMCAEVSKLPKKGELVVFNPLTGEKTALPPLIYPRNPVLVHIAVNSAQKSYKVVVAGSSTASDEHLSRKMEVFDSSTSEWKETTDLPGPAFGLNEHQAGVYLNGTLFFVSFLEGDSGLRGVVAFDVENGKWLKNLACPIPFSLHSNILQLVENDGKLYLFSEQELGESVEHCIDVLEGSSLNAGAMDRQWRNVVRVKKTGGRGLLVYPEYSCYVEDFKGVGFGEGKLCIFDTLTRDGVVYDMRDGKQLHVLEPPPPNQTGDNFYTMNPASFTFQPSFVSDPSFSMPSR